MYWLRKKRKEKKILPRDQKRPSVYPVSYYQLCCNGQCFNQILLHESAFLLYRHFNSLLSYKPLYLSKHLTYTNIWMIALGQHLNVVFSYEELKYRFKISYEYDLVHFIVVLIIWGFLIVYLYIKDDRRPHVS